MGLLDAISSGFKSVADAIGTLGMWIAGLIILTLIVVLIVVIVLNSKNNEKVIIVNGKRYPDCESCSTESEHRRKIKEKRKKEEEV